jgi:hypothetical protein
MKDATVGDNVAVPIPSVDRGRGDPRNILSVILAVENGQYTIGCPSDILKGKYSRHQFDLCPQRLLSESDINSDNSVSLRQANKRSLHTVVRVSSSAIVMDLRDVGVSDVLVSKIMFCVIADVTTVYIV